MSNIFDIFSGQKLKNIWAFDHFFWPFYTFTTPNRQKIMHLPKNIWSCPKIFGQFLTIFSDMWTEKWPIFTSVPSLKVPKTTQKCSQISTNQRPYPPQSYPKLLPRHPKISIILLCIWILTFFKVLRRVFRDHCDLVRTNSVQWITEILTIVCEKYR